MGENSETRGAGRKLLALVTGLEELETAGVTELAEHLSLPKSTVHYHLDILQESGFAVREDGEYQLSLRFLEIGERTRKRIPFYHVAKPEVNALAEETDELAILMVEECGLGVYLHKATGENAIDIDAPIGRHAQLHNRALGKAILAYTPEERVREIITDRGLSRTTDQTITDEAELFEELSRIRERDGVSYNDQESLEGLRGVAVPILDDDETVLGAMSIAGPTARMKGDRFETEIPELLQRNRNIVELTVRNT